jgi:trehalose/maltose hydrolase-like predicted phosphorylase
VLELNPHLPEFWNKLSFKIYFRSIWYAFEFTKENVKIEIVGKGKKQIPVKIAGKSIQLMPGKTKSILY